MSPLSTDWESCTLNQKDNMYKALGNEIGWAPSATSFVHKKDQESESTWSNFCIEEKASNVGCAKVMSHLELATYDKVDARMTVAAKDNGLTFKAWDTQFGRQLCLWDAGRERHEWCRRGDAERDKFFQHEYGPAAAAADMPEGTVEAIVSCMKGESLAYVKFATNLEETRNKLSSLGGEVILDKFRLATGAKDVDIQIAVCLAAERALETLKIPHPFVAEVVSEDSSVEGSGTGRMTRCNNWFEKQSGSAAGGVSGQ